MLNLYETNGLVFWDAKAIKRREYLKQYFADRISDELLKLNPAWRFHEVEAPLLTPRSILNPNYTDEDIWAQQNSDLALRPETTPGSYVYAEHLLSQAVGAKPPLVVWQAGKSFRREQDQVTKNMRLKEFYQQEFQCLYTSDTMNDYYTAMVQKVGDIVAQVIPRTTRIVPSDRLPSYSLMTMDVEIDQRDRWMEVCSISKRTDFTKKAVFRSKDKVVERDIIVLEIAIGLDRCVYNLDQWSMTRSAGGEMV